MGGGIHQFDGALEDSSVRVGFEAHGRSIHPGSTDRSSVIGAPGRPPVVLSEEVGLGWVPGGSSHTF